MTEQEILADIADYKLSIKQSENVIEGEKLSIAKYYKWIAERYEALEELRKSRA